MNTYIYIYTLCAVSKRSLGIMVTYWRGNITYILHGKMHIGHNSDTSTFPNTKEDKNIEYTRGDDSKGNPLQSIYSFILEGADTSHLM